jgi:hypothetical protein
MRRQQDLAEAIENYYDDGSLELITKFLSNEDGDMELYYGLKTEIDDCGFEEELESAIKNLFEYLSSDRKARKVFFLIGENDAIPLNRIISSLDKSLLESLIQDYQAAPPTRDLVTIADHFKMIQQRELATIGPLHTIFEEEDEASSPEPTLITPPPLHPVAIKPQHRMMPEATISTIAPTPPQIPNKAANFRRRTYVMPEAAPTRPVAHIPEFLDLTSPEKNITKKPEEAVARPTTPPRKISEPALEM